MAYKLKNKEELVARINSEISATDRTGSELSDQRRQAIEYYMGEPFGNEVDGRSQIVSRDVADTIEWIKPSLMRVFSSGDEVVRFEPEGPEDVGASEQATDYCNYVFERDNNGFELLYSWFTDALLSKNGIIKVWWDESIDRQREEYQELSPEEFEALLSDPDIEVKQHTEITEDDVDPDTGASMVTSTHDVVVIRTNTKGRVKIENVPPEEFLISREAKSIDDAMFVAHKVRKTKSQLKQEGFDVGDISSSNEGDFNMERAARFDHDQTYSYGESFEEEALRTYWVYECYLRSDQDGDGIAELLKVTMVGNTILSCEPVDRIPFASLTPIKVPHKFHGLSMADLVMDLQLIKSTLMRNLLDNMYLINHGRYVVLDGQANLDDLLTSRPGGVIRTKVPGAVQRLDTPSLEPYTFQMLDYIDGIREERSGVNKYSQGLNDNALSSHTSASAVSQVMTAAQQRVELIARLFAETGVKDLFRQIYELVQKYQDKERVIKLRGQWVPVRPDMWRDKMDCTVTVGLGHGNRDQQRLHLSTLLQFAAQSMSGGLSIVNERNLYNLGAQMIKNMGFKNVSDFLTDPETVQKGQNPEDQVKAKELQLKESELNIKLMEAQTKQMEAQLDVATKQKELQLKEAELMIEATQQRPVAVG